MNDMNRNDLHSFRMAGLAKAQAEVLRLAEGIAGFGYYISTLEAGDLWRDEWTQLSASHQQYAQTHKPSEETPESVAELLQELAGDLKENRPGTETGSREKIAAAFALAEYDRSLNAIVQATSANPPIPITPISESADELAEPDPIRLDDLWTNPPPEPDFVVSRLIPTGVVTLLGGHGGAGKSHLALVLAAHVACGQSWAGLECPPGRVLYISLEDNGQTCRSRLKRIIVNDGLDFAALARNLRLYDEESLSEAAAKSGIELDVELATFDHGKGQTTGMYRMVSKLAAGARLIVIDNASDTFGGDEVKRREVRFFIRALGKLARREQAGLVLLVHIDKLAARGGSVGNSYSGSTAWHNSARSRIALIPNQEGKGVKLVHEKINEGQPLDPLELEFRDGCLMPAGTTATTTDQELDDRLIATIRRAIEQGTTIPGNRTGPVNSFNTLKSYGLDEDKASTYRCLDRLIDRRVIKVCEYQKDGKSRTRILLYE
jgi:hypothetical protein